MAETRTAARERIREATVDLVIEGGYERLTVAEVIERSGVRQAEFDALYADEDDLYRGVFDEVVAPYEEAVQGAFAAHEEWREALRACAYAAARHIRDHPREVRFGVVQMFAAGDMAQVQRERQLQRMVDLVDQGRRELDDPDSIGRGVAESTIGSIYGFLVKEMQSGEGVAVAERYVPELMYIAVRPYLGHEVAREELTIPPPPEQGAGFGA